MDGLRGIELRNGAKACLHWWRFYTRTGPRAHDNSENPPSIAYLEQSAIDIFSCAYNVFDKLAKKCDAIYSVISLSYLQRRDGDLPILLPSDLSWPLHVLDK